MTVHIINADVMDGLAQLPDESVHCVVTSPPYWGLRDYGMSGQIGLEPKLGEHIEAMVKVFRDVRRVLRKDGTLWLNYGDCYHGSWGNSGNRPELDGKGGTQRNKTAAYLPRGGWDGHRDRPPSSWPQEGLKPKDLCGVPWRVAFALQADGWWLRQDIIWSKPNPMPESIKDRCTKAHEYLFLLAKSERYYFDAEAIAEPANYSGITGMDGSGFKDPQSFSGKHSRTKLFGERKVVNGPDSGTRNKRSVWEIASQPFSEAHFATFPPALIEPCIKAGSKIGNMILDPFGGSGTTGLVADRLKRNAILIELNPEYAAMANRRIVGDCPMFAEVSAMKNIRG